jgi:hypothetical protein
MTVQTLGRLEKVDIREIWKHEAIDFTPWLADPENIKLLGDAIGMELEVEAVEKDVGHFFADILCKDTASDRFVVIENQIEPTDHDHLGKTITYAAGLQATAMVWIAKHFAEEHRAALDWLNEITGAEVAFFGLEIEAWKIGDSPAAPKFNIVCRPNEFTTSTTTQGTLSETRQAQLDFWLAFKEYMDESSTVKCAKPSPNNWLNHPIGRSGVHMDSIMSSYDSLTGKAGGEFRVELYIDDGHAKETLAALQQQQAVVEEALSQLIPEELSWYCKEGVQACRIYVRKPAEIFDRDRWSEHREWLKSRLEAFDSVFRSVLKELDMVAASLRGTSEEQRRHRRF